MPETISEEQLRELEQKAAATERLHNAPGGTPWPRQSLKVVEVPYGVLRALIAAYRKSRPQSWSEQQNIALGRAAETPNGE